LLVFELRISRKSSSEAALARALTRADDPDLCRRPGACRHR
jgi:hypothetical protein